MNLSNRKEIPKNGNELPRGKRVLLVGLSRSGVAAARALAPLGYELRGADSSIDLDPAVRSDLEKLGVTLELGPHGEKSFLGSHWIVLSPGVPRDLAPLVSAGAEEIPILGELELAFRLARLRSRGEDRGKFVAITGTNGKSTTTMMVGAMLSAAGKDHLVGGNIGTPLSHRLESVPEWIVAEVSSFQLEAVERFRPRVAALLNLSEDHLERHGGFGAYVEAKAAICQRMGAGDCLVYNADDDAVVALVKRWPTLKKMPFSPLRPVEGACIVDECLSLWRHGQVVPVLEIRRVPLEGLHNQENALAALAVGSELGLSDKAMSKALEEYRPLPHRCQLVGECRDVRFYDDSKATNVGAAVKTLESFPGTVVLIAGGKDKGGDLSPLVESIGRKARWVVLMGEARKRLAKSLREFGRFEMAISLTEAVELAFQRAEPGDSVVLAPACSSYDMFRDYRHRGEAFCRAAAAVCSRETAASGASRRELKE